MTRAKSGKSDSKSAGLALPWVKSRTALTNIRIRNPMKPEKKKPVAEEELEALEIKLKRIPIENLAEVTETLDRVRKSAQKLVGKLAELTDQFENGEITATQLEYKADSIGKALIMLKQGLRIVLSASAAKEKLNSGKK
jgi:hypothetical protein